MTKPTDDLEAVRVVVEALQGFDANDQERIIRWAREKLGLPVAAASGPVTVDQQQSAGESSAAPSPLAHSSATPRKDLKTFVVGKKPKNDVQFAATVAYFHRFEAAEQKSEISSNDLRHACRLTGGKWRLLHHPDQTLRNAVSLGLLDKIGRGTFTINSVGENLVAMTLPHDSSTATAPKARANRGRRPVAKKATGARKAKK